MPAKPIPKRGRPKKIRADLIMTPRRFLKLESELETKPAYFRNVTASVAMMEDAGVEGQLDRVGVRAVYTRPWDMALRGLAFGKALEASGIDLTRAKWTVFTIGAFRDDVWDRDTVWAKIKAEYIRWQNGHMRGVDHYSVLELAHVTYKGRGFFLPHINSLHIGCLKHKDWNIGILGAPASLVVYPKKTQRWKGPGTYFYKPRVDFVTKTLDERAGVPAAQVDSQLVARTTQLLRVNLNSLEKAGGRFKSVLTETRAIDLKWRMSLLNLGQVEYRAAMRENPYEIVGL